MKKKNLIGLFVTLFLVALPLAAAADQDPMEGMHGMNGMILLGTDTQDGVKAMGHLMNVPEGDRSGATHHFMVMFNDEKSGAPITEGLVALKITDPTGATSQPIRLMPMTMGMVKGFGAGVKLTENASYRFEVGCRLADGQKRQFNFTSTLK